MQFVTQKIIREYLFSMNYRAKKVNLLFLAKKYYLKNEENMRNITALYE